VHLVNDVYFILSGLRWDAYLIDQVADVIYRVVGRGIEFKHIECEISFGSS
jgi:hypothetical protein